MDIALGVVGAIVGGFIFSGAFGMSGVTGLNIWSRIVSVIGAIIVLLIYHAVAARNLSFGPGGVSGPEIAGAVT